MAKENGCRNEKIGNPYPFKRQRIPKYKLNPKTRKGTKIMRRLNRKPKKENLYQVTRTCFIGNKNEITYYRDRESQRTYAKAQFDYMEVTKSYLYEEWFQISKSDIKNEESQIRTEKKICLYFGWIGIEKNRLF